MQLSRTPAPPSRGPTPAARPLAVTTLAAPDAPEDWRRGCPPGFPGGSRRRPGAAATFPFAVRHQGRRTRPRLRALGAPARAPLLPLLPSLACPRAPLCASLRPDPQGAPLTPPCGGRGSGRVGHIGVGRASRAGRAVALGGFLYLAAKLSGPLAPLALLPLTPTPPSLLSLGSFFRVNYVSH